MSKKQKLIATFLTLVMIFACNMNVFAWTTSSSSFGSHAYLVSSAGSWGKLNSLEQRLLLKAVNTADEAPFQHPEDDTVHSAGNYVKNLRFLYTVSYKLLNTSGDGGGWENVIDVTAAEFVEPIGRVHKNIIGDAKQIMRMNIDTDNGESTYRLRSIKILGLAMHLGGDIYAHQAILPVGSRTQFETILTNNGIILTRNQSAILNNMNANSSIRFKDIVQQDNIFSAKLFEDSANFFPERYTNASRYTTNELLDYYTSNKEWGLSILLPWTQTYGCTMTYTNDIWQTVTTNLKMSNLSSNITKSGYSDGYVQNKFGINPNDYTVFR